MDEKSDRLCPIGLTNSCAYWVKLEAENKQLRKYIDTIGKYAYKQHLTVSRKDSHSQLYAIAEMCRKSKIKQVLKGEQDADN